MWMWGGKRRVGSVDEKRSSGARWGAPELLFLCLCAAGAGSLKQAEEPTAEVAYPRTDLDNEEDEQVDEEDEQEAEGTDDEGFAVDLVDDGAVALYESGEEA